MTNIYLLLGAGSMFLKIFFRGSIHCRGTWYEWYFLFPVHRKIAGINIPAYLSVRECTFSMWLRICHFETFFGAELRTFRTMLQNSIFRINSPCPSSRLALALKYVPHVIRAIFFVRCIPKVNLLGVFLRAESLFFRTSAEKF